MGGINAETKINLADGSTSTIKYIIKNKLNVPVLGYINNTVVHVKIINWIDKGLSKNWYKLKFSRKHMGLGSSHGSIMYSGEQKIFTNYKYTNCDEIQNNDIILSIRKDSDINYLQEQVLIGKLLGDGSLVGKNRRIEFNHITKYAEYVQYTLEALGDIANTHTRLYTSGYGSPIIRAKTLDKYYIEKYFSEWVNTGKKKVPKSIIGKLSPISLAFWYMDDGSLAHNNKQKDRATFATCGFDEYSIDNLISAFSCLGIKAKKYKHDYWRIHLSTIEAEKLFILISPYIPTCMRYKLPEKYKNLPFINLSSYNQPNEDKMYPIPQTIISNKEKVLYKISTRQYSIQTESDNFFANNVLVKCM